DEAARNVIGLLRRRERERGKIVGVKRPHVQGVDQRGIKVREYAVQTDLKVAIGLTIADRIGRACSINREHSTQKRDAADVDSVLGGRLAGGNIGYRDRPEPRRIERRVEGMNAAIRFGKGVIARQDGIWITAGEMNRPAIARIDVSRRTSGGNGESALCAAVDYRWETRNSRRAFEVVDPHAVDHIKKQPVAITAE